MPMAKIDGASLYYESKGTGPAVIFVHPPVLSSICFERQVKHLSKQFRTIVFDIRGNGKSPASATPVTYSLIARDMKQLMDYLEIPKAFFCGYSTGGSVILEFLLHYPERALGSILVGAFSEVQDLRLRTRISLGIGLAKSRAIRTLALGLSWSHADSSEVFWKTFRNAAKANAANVEQYYRASLRYNCTQGLSEIRHPVLLVYGKKDRPFHAYGRLLHERLPDSELIYLPKAGHRIPLFFSYELNTVISWFILVHQQSQSTG